MNKILNFFNKFGLLITTLLVFIIFINTCGVKGNIEKNGRRSDKMEKSLSNIDSIVSTKVSEDRLKIMLEINGLEVAREVVYTNNSIVRTTQRPDDVINSYNQKIKELQNKLSNTK